MAGPGDRKEKGIGMTSQTSKAALWSFEQAEWLATSTQTQNPMVSGELDELYRSILPEGEEVPDLPDFKVVQSSNVLLLLHSADNVRRADQAHRKNLVELDNMRSRRRQMAEGFKQRYRDERKSFEGTYGEDSLAYVGLDAPPGLSFLAVREQLLEFRERLRDPETPGKLGNPLPGHSPVEPETLADAVDGEVSAYDTLMTDIRQQRKRADESLSVKKAALADHRRVVVNVARIQEGYYRLVGLDDLADRIRAARRRRKAKEDETPENGAQPENGETPESPESAEMPESPVAAEAAESPETAETAEPSTPSSSPEEPAP